MPKRKTPIDKNYPRCIIFDLFGVVFSKGLAGSIHHLENVFRRNAAEVTPTYTKWENQFDIGEINEKQFWEKINSELNTNVDSELLTQLVLTSYKIDSRVVQMIKYYRDHAMIVSYSNYRREWFDRLNRKYMLSDLFDRVFISSDTRLLKPDQRVFDYVASELTKEKKNIIIVDDDQKNVDAATKSGCRGILYREPFTSDYAIRSILFNVDLKFDAQYSGVLLETKDGALILQRRDQKAGIANPGLLSVFGGRRIKGESAVECAQRELNEEVGLSLESTQFEQVCRLSCPIENQQWMECTYFKVRNVELSKIAISEGDSVVVRWPETALRDLEITEIVRALIREVYG